MTGKPLFSARKRAALLCAEAMTRSDLAGCDDHFGALRLQFDHDATIELTGLIAFQNLVSKFNNALAVPKLGFCQFSSAPEASDRLHGH